MTVVEANKRPWVSRCLFFGIVFLLSSLPESVWAVQQHGGIEGMVTHELGHLLFMAGMLFLLYRMRQPETFRMTRGSGWFEFKLFIWLIIVWNVLTFYGHWHEEIISPDKFITIGGKRIAFIVSRPLDLFFYLSRLDHLVLLPAFLFLFLAQRKWRNQG